MPSVTDEIIIELPHVQVWERMRDLSKADYYVPGLQGCRLDTEQKDGIGASRTVNPKNMAPLQETVVEWEEGRRFVIRLHRGDKPMAPFKSAEFVYEIEAVDAARTRFKPAIRYVVGGGIFGALLERLLLRRLFKKNVHDVATHLKRFYETGQPSNPEFKPS
jgi:ribosome-associated toxin RatA of RatAB toxin-antitoxin module